MRGVVLVAVILAAVLSGPAAAAPAPQQSPAAPAATATGAVPPAALEDRAPAFAGERRAGEVAGPAATPADVFADKITDQQRDPAGPPAVTVDTRLALTPDRPGELRVRLQVARRAAPGNGSGDVSVGLSGRATVVDAEGFDRVGDRFRLAPDHGAGTITYRLAVNRTTADGGYEAVDAGEWALVRTPSPSVRADGGAAERSFEVAGAGVVHSGLAYLGPYREHERPTDGQLISLVVPEAATMQERPVAVLDSLSRASRTLRVGDRDPRVLFVAAPTGVDWGYAAQEIGDAAAWVAADQSLHDPRNAWLHEYVHTRQAFRPDRETRWLVEGTATYFAALLSLRQGLVDYEAYRQHLESGTTASPAGAVLAAPDTWGDNRAEYAKGALVAADLDRRLMAATGRSFQAVFARLNARDGHVALSTFTTAVAAVGTEGVSSVARRQATTRGAPATWERGVHRRTFGWGPPEVAIDEVVVTASGPGGPRAVATGSEGVVLLTDQRLVASVLATNEGGGDGRAVAALRVGGTVVDRAVEPVAAGEDAMVTVSYRFGDPGTYRVAVGDRVLRVEVVRPARSVRVSDVRVGAGPRGDEGAVTVVTQVHNRQDRPARVSLPVTVDGEVVAVKTVAVGPNRQRNVRTRVTLDQPGRHEVAIAGERTAVNLSESGAVVTTTGTGPGTLPPGELPRGLAGLFAMAGGFSLAAAAAYRRL